MRTRRDPARPHEYEPLLQKAREVANTSLARLRQLCEKYPDDFNRVLEAPSKTELLRVRRPAEPPAGG